LDWSYTLLSDSERLILQQLSIFAGGWTLDAAQAICTGDTISPVEVMDLLSNLVDKSLVIVDDHDSGRRYRLLETIRQYALQKLVAAKRAVETQNRHLAYFLNWAEMAEVHLAGPHQQQWLAQFNTEHDNLRAALDWSLTAEGQAETGLRLACACGHYWRLHGYLSEGRTRLAAALNQAGAQAPTAARAWALLWAANLAYLQSDYAATGTLAEEGLSTSRELGQTGQRGVAKALDILGEMATETGDYATALSLLAEALTIYRTLDDRRGIADMLMQLGWAAMRSGDYPRADALLNECLPLLQELGESALLGLVLSGLGELALRQGQYEQAVKLLEESLAVRRELGERWGIAICLGSLGWAALQQRDFSLMHQQLAESLDIRLELGDQGGIAWCVEKLAEAAVIQAPTLPAPYRRRARQRAARLFGAAAALRAPINSVIDPADQPDYEQTLTSLQRTLGNKAFQSAWDEGEKMLLLEIVELALAPLLTKEETAVLSDAEKTKAKFGGLSSREQETAILIAQGKANREIAEIMVVRVKTVETYVTRILNKLGFDSRVQIATWAVETGLVETQDE
jgi:DNA-binding CsgD family transcriptional regulator/tetratricopeptide (TPR) repeat protein